jgi:ligand-binding SRPBCC domain-containing protein
MPTIILETKICSHIERVFDISRNVDIHIMSSNYTKEQAIAGKLSGLLELDETVTWRAKHFGIYQTIQTRITAFHAPNYFVDEMIKGTFKSFRHEHHFEKKEQFTLMTDVFEFETPFGIIGKLVNILFLTRYLKRFLTRRNEFIKLFAENSVM